MSRVALALCLALGLLTACGETPSDKETAPEVGACRNLHPGDIDKRTNDTHTVDCDKAHTAQTFLVSTLPASSGENYDSPDHGKHVYAVCSKAFARFLGADESMALRTNLRWGWFMASEKGWDKGARWFRCDVVGATASDQLPELPETAKGLLRTKGADEWMRCARGASVNPANEVPCSQEHDWRAVTAVKIGKPEESYPGDRISEVRARDACSDWVGAWQNYPVDYTYSYAIFHEAEWKAGNRRAVCWARTDQ